MRVALILVLFLFAFPLPSRAEDHGQYAAVPAPIRACFKAQRNALNTPCCDGADATRVEDPDWGQNDKGYWVRINGKVIQIPADRLAQGKPCVGYAVVWFYNGNLQCFMAGSRS